MKNTIKITRQSLAERLSWSETNLIKPFFRRKHVAMFFGSAMGNIPQTVSANLINIIDLSPVWDGQKVPANAVGLILQALSVEDKSSSLLKLIRYFTEHNKTKYNRFKL